MNFYFENSTLLEPQTENIFFNQENDYEKENELSYTNESSNSYNLCFFQNEINDTFPCFYEKEEKNTFEEKKEKLEKDLFEIQKKEDDQKLLIFNKNEVKDKDKDKEQSTSQKDSTPLVKRKRGRGRQDDLNSSLNENDKIHNKFSTDNLLRKVQVHYMTFIISFVNEILGYLNYKEKFLKLDYEFKKNVNKKFVESLKNKNIGEIICNKISVKYKKQDINSNKILYEKIKQDKVICNIFSENYLKLFKKIYFKNNKIINLKEYGLDEEIILSKEVKIFKDLIKENEDSEEYQKNINECALQNYLPNSLFLLDC